MLPWLEAPLRQALQTARGHHALLIHGSQGVGQFELAMALAAAWLCEGATDERPQGRACGACASCKLIAARTHPDLLVLLPEALQEALGWSEAGEPADSEGGKSKAKPSKDIRVEAVRAAVAFAQQTSARGGAKLVVLHPAERMNATSANTLLKTLEEPPGSARFILSTAAAQRLLPTVRSRCQPLRLSLPDQTVALDWLRAQDVARPEVLLAASGGQPLAVIERLALGCDAAAWLRLPAELRAGQAPTLVGWPLPLVVDALQKFCHDALAMAVGAAPRYFPAAALPAVPASVARLTACAGELRRAARQAEHPWNAPLAVEALVQMLHQALPPMVTVKSARGPGTPLATLRP